MDVAIAAPYSSLFVPHKRQQCGGEILKDFYYDCFNRALHRMHQFYEFEYSPVREAREGDRCEEGGPCAKK